MPADYYSSRLSQVSLENRPSSLLTEITLEREEESVLKAYQSRMAQTHRRTEASTNGIEDSRIEKPDVDMV